MKYALTLLCIACGLACATASGGTRAAAPTPLRADIAEWSIVPSTGSVPAGRVRIVVRNLGAVAHEVVLVPTARFADRLPLRGSRAVTRNAAASVVVEPGATRSFVVALHRGSYLLVDNLPWHYWHGTSAAFSVR